MAVTNELLQSENIGMATYHVRYVHPHNVQNIVCTVRATVAVILRNIWIVSKGVEIHRICT